jgi:hypothetical protein
MVSEEFLISTHAGAYKRSICPGTESSPNGNADEDVVPGTGVVELAGGGTAPGGGATGLPVGILPLAKLILHRSSVRKSMSAFG